MFGKLKEKLKNWAQKISKDKSQEIQEEDIVEIPVEVAPPGVLQIAEGGGKEEVFEKPEKEVREVKKEEKLVESKEIKEEKKIKKEETQQPAPLGVPPGTRTSEEVPQSTEFRGKKEIKLPVKYDAAQHKYIPDTKKLAEKEIIKEELKEPIAETEAEKPGTPGFFKKITSKINKVKISEKEFNIYAEELEMLLLENNVALEVTEKIIKELKEKIIGKELLRKEIASEITDIFKEIIKEILVEPFDIIEKVQAKLEDQSKEPYVILFCGINGTGKTTTIAKIADSLKRKGLSCVIAAADTFRAASIEQIQKHGEKIGVKVISQDYGSDPAAVGFDAVKYAKKNVINCVLIVTAGRMHTAKNLIKEIEKISKVCNPDLKIFVGESITGNDILEQVRSFDWAIGIDGIILSKADIDEKGGTALSAGYVTKKPILYLGTGQYYDEIEAFDKQKFIERLGL